MSEPVTGFPGDAESGGWAGEPGQALFTAGGVVGSRSADGSELDPLAGAASVTVGTWPPADWGPKLYQIGG